MSEYTPTTEEVRNGYVGAGYEPNPYVSEDERAEFDRWLAEVKIEAWSKGYKARSYDAVYGTMTHNPYIQKKKQ